MDKPTASSKKKKQKQNRNTFIEIEDNVSN